MHIDNIDNGHDLRILIDVANKRGTFKKTICFTCGHALARAHTRTHTYTRTHAHTFNY